ncbi:ABC transporter-like [Trinorchestia longiramus]|nr:ABC transporter-like [Trinorchestia longiramus]
MKGSLRNKKKLIPFAPPPQWVTELVYPLFQVPGPRERNSSNGPKPGYYDEGYLSLQHAVDMAIAEHYSGRRPSVEVEMGRMPYPPYVDDKYLVALQAWLPLILLLSYLYPAVNIVKNVVYEKEKKLKESMKMMGLPNYLHWAAWFVKSLAFLTVTTLLITLLLCTKWQGAGSLAVLHNSDPSLVFCFLCVYLLTVISFCFMLSTLFSKANIAATVTGLLWIFSYLPNEFLRPRYGYIGASCKLVLCFFFKIALGYGCQLMSMFEGTGSGAQWDLLFEGVSPDDPLTLGHVMLVMMLDAVIYALLAWYIEAVFPGQFGVPQPWNFPFLRSYWLGVEDTGGSAPPSYSIGAHLPDPDFFEPDPAGQQIGIQIKGLTKVFPRGNKVAVSNMHLNMYCNQMTVLLGHNGAGKTTTMSMLTGLFPPTCGTALVNGYDIVKEMTEVRRSIGICPQHDVLFDELTVAEHIEFFSILKGLPRDKVASEIQAIVAALKLEDKVLAQSRTLSGGMKRKLSVGIALCAGSRVVILDEPTSGMDPGARRLIWDLLQKEKQGRTLLLTTHFMEEADLLGDRIAIMALGVVQCCGSSMFLKKRYGSGYHLVIVKQDSCDVSAVTATIQKYIRDARLDTNHGAELSYVLPNEEVAKFEQLFNELEDRREELKVSSYGASQTTMDEVFLRVGENAEQREQLRLYSAEAAAATVGSSSAGAADLSDAVELQAPTSPLNGAVLNKESGRSSGAKHHARTGSSVSVNSMKMQLMREIEEQAARDIAMKPEKGALLQHQHHGNDIEETVLSFDAPDPRRPSASGTVMQKVLAAAVSITSIASASETRRRRVPARRNTGPRLLAQHFWAMLVKKTLYVLRNRVISIVQMLIPVVFLILAILIVRTLPGAIDSPPPLWASFGPYRGTVTPLQEYTSSNESTALTSALRGLLTGADVTIDPQLGDSTMVDYLLKQSAADLPSFHLSWMMAVEVTGRADSPTLVSVLFNGKPYHVPTAALNLIDNAVVQTHTGYSQLQIETINHPLPRTDTDKLTQDSRQNLGFNIGFNLAFSLSFLSGSLVMFLVRERSSNAKHLQFVSGVNFVTYWLATAIVDFCIYLVPYFLIMVCLKVFNEEGMREPSQLGLILLVLVLYSWAMAPLMYLASFFFTVPSSGFTRMSILNVFVGMATLITVTMLRIPDLELQHIADLLDWVFLLLPPYAMASSLTDLYTNFRSRQICDRPAIEMSCGWGSIFANPCCKSNENCGDYGCVLWQSSMVAWDKLGIGRMLVFLAIEGLVFYILIALVELKARAGVVLKARAVMALKARAVVALKARAGVAFKTRTGVSLKTRTGVSLKTRAGVSLKTRTGVSLKARAGVSLKARAGVSLMTMVGVVLKTRAGVSLKARAGVSLKTVVFQSANYFFAKVKQKIINGNSTFASTWSSGLRGRDADLEEDVRKEATRIQTTSTESLFKTDILIFKDLTKRYSNNHLAVDHLNLGVPPGECFGLLGINGAGKTTTFKMLTGDLTVTSGEAYVNGYSITNQIKKVQQEVGYCPQFDAILDQMTGRETLRMFARLRGVPESCIDEQITDLAQQLIVTPHLDNLVGNYSGGNKRKISTGIALIGEPPLVLLDEPTSGMDPVARRHLWDVLNSARNAGRSIVLTSHRYPVFESLPVSDRVSLLLMSSPSS